VEEFARAGRTADESETASLTPRESEVLSLVAAGATNREIAAALDVTENTVSFHVKNIFAKLHLKNRAQAAAYAVGSGLAKPPDRGTPPPVDSPPQPRDDEIRQRLRQLDVDGTTPRDALQFLADLRTLVDD